MDLEAKNLSRSCHWIFQTLKRKLPLKTALTGTSIHHRLSSTTLYGNKEVPHATNAWQLPEMHLAGDSLLFDFEHEADLWVVQVSRSALAQNCVALEQSQKNHLFLLFIYFSFYLFSWPETNKRLIDGTIVFYMHIGFMCHIYDHTHSQEPVATGRGLSLGLDLT